MFKFIKKLFKTSDKKHTPKKFFNSTPTVTTSEKCLNGSTNISPHQRNPEINIVSEKPFYDIRTFKRDLREFFSALTIPPIKKIVPDQDIINDMKKDIKEGFLTLNSFEEALSYYYRQMPMFEIEIQSFKQFAKTDTFAKLTKYPDLASNQKSLIFIVNTVDRYESQSGCSLLTLPKKQLNYF